MNKKLKTAAGSFTKQVGLIIVALFIATIFLWVSGYEPLAMVNGIFNSISSDIGGTIRWATPLILAGLAICVTYKAEVFNLGVDGQIYIGASLGTVVALALPGNLSSGVAIPVVIIACMIGGALYALIPALLKVYAGTNEVVSTLLFNFIAVQFVEYLIAGPLKDTASGMNLNASSMLPENTWLPRLSYLGSSSANVGFYIAIALVVIMAFLFYRTTLGHEIKVVGANPTLARYAGMKPKKNVLQVMAISGAIAGLVGATEILAVQHRLLSSFNPDLGFEGIVVSLLANNNPIGVLFSGFFFGALRNGGMNMERSTEVPSAVTDIVMAIIIIIVAAKFALPRLRLWYAGVKERRASAAGKEVQ